MEQQTKSEPIALIGMDCRVPQADGTDAFWDLLRAGQCVAGPVPEARMRLTGQRPGEADPFRWGALLSDIEMFDARLFGMSPREAQTTDPQQRILLETAWHALESAQIAPDSLAGSDAGVFVGVSYNDYLRVQHGSPTVDEAHGATCFLLSVVANRLSHVFDLHGPSVVVDTACASSLSAVHQACASLAAGETGLALAGGVNLALDNDLGRLLANSQVLSKSGRCRTFDERADGFVRGEGCGVVVLKRLADALRDGDPVLAVIRGSAASHNGNSDTLAAPSGAAQLRSIRTTLERAGWSGAAVGYVEAHGTGTAVGDPIEVAALRQALDTAPGADAVPCWLGAAKSVVGHAEPAAGVIGLIKAVLVLRHRHIPANAGFRRLNPRIDLAGSRLRVADRPIEWEAAPGQPRRALVASFGMGGANVHMAVEEFKGEAVVAASAPQEARPALLGLSARTEASLRALARDYAALLEKGEGGDHDAFAAVCRAANTSRAVLRERLAVAGADAGATAALLRGWADGGGEAGGVSGVSRGSPSAPRIAFLFTGQGAQRAGMGQALYQDEPVFRAFLDRCDAILRPWLGLSIREVMFGSAAALLEETRYAQPALVAFELSLAALWRHWGVEPEFVVGHSIGEVSAACVAGVMDLQTALWLVAERGRVMSADSGRGAMLSVRAGLAAVEAALGPRLGEVDVAALNAPDQVVLSGSVGAIAAVRALLDGQALESTPVNVGHAFHSRLMDPVLDEFGAVCRGLDLQAPARALLPTGGPSEGGEGADMAQPDYWARQLRHPVAFMPAVRRLVAMGADTFVEIGPSAVLTSLGRRSAGRGAWIASQRGGIDERLQLRAALGELFVRGAPVDFKRVDDHRELPRVPVPLYAFDREPHWFGRPGGGGRAVRTPAAGPVDRQDLSLLGEEVSLALDDTVCFETELPDAASAFLLDHRVAGRALLPAAGYLGLALDALRRCQPTDGGAWVLSGWRFHRIVDLTDQSVRLQTVLRRREAGSGDWSVRLASWNGEARRWEPCADGRAAVEAPAAQAPLRAAQRGPQAIGVPPAAGEVENFYAQCRAHGLEYGAGFQGVAGLRRDGAGVEGDVRLPPEVPRAVGLVHPVLLDSAFQLMVGLLLGEAADGTPQDAAVTRIPLPVGLDRLVCRAPCAGAVHVAGRLTAPSQEEDGRLLTDLVLRDGQGRALVEIDGFAVAWAHPSRIAAQTSGDSLPPVFYRPAWVEAGVDPQAMPAPGVALCVYAPSSAALAQAVVARYAPGACRVLALGDLAPGPVQVDAPDPGGLAEALRRLPPFETVYFLGALPPEGGDDGVGWPALAQSETSGVLGLFRLLKALAAQGHRERPLCIRCVACANHAVSPGDLCQPLGAGLAGLVKTAAAEFSMWTLTHVDIGRDDARRDAATRDRTAARLTGPLARIPEGAPRELALRNGHWFRPVLRPLQLPAPAETPLREGGVYLIVGGAGGIGLEIAGELARRQRARVVLLGRSAPSDALRARLGEIEAMGGEALYLQADATDGEALRGAVAAAKARFGALHGVFHAPLVLRDQAIEQMGDEAMRAGLAPKVDGSVNLYRAVQDESLDFLVFFSSVLALTGNPGQANYVAANAFQDAYARAAGRRAGFPVKTIQWGLWGEAGAVAGDYYVQRLERQGVGALSNREGMEALRRALASDLPQLAAVKAGAAYEAAMGVEGGAKVAPAAARPGPAPLALRTPAELSRLAEPEALAALLSGLRSLAGQALRMDMGREFGDDARLAGTPFSMLGIDSLMAMELREGVRRWLDVRVPTALFIGRGTVGEAAAALYEQLLVDRLTAGVAIESGEQEILTL